MFFELSQNPEMAAEAAVPKSSRPESRETSVDNGPSGVPEAPAQRRKLQLLPRSKPANEASADQSEDGEHEDTSMSEAEAKRKIDEVSKEFFSVRNLEEADKYFKKFISEQRFHLVDKLLNAAIESKEVDP